ncbi:hypothetical protein [cf. Phormidesmis sp. LEGE 11477]|uniref:hypothetical protein n=1 Tax=cf. Phormidesmis sp. LEGE 11477 TaxID=1828680 RepID=UPI0018813610|nr:hypothetical protein [cf. Phormidesmis sp. LEGE 11477]MBE9062454.1 hypothetical protein [cf. Phormidesmis sp. LEGE 11477]
MSQQDSIELRLTGNGISPGTIRSKDIAQLIDAVEDMIASKVVAENPSIRKDQIVIGLSNIEEGSVGLLFASSVDELTSSAAKAIASSITAEDFYSLPEDSIRSLKTISAFTRSRDCHAEIYDVNDSKKLLAVITPTTKILEYEPIRGETSIYGTVTRVGGSNEEKPTIQFRTIEGHLLYCSASKRNAKIAAQHLYQKIGLIGVAEWDAKTFSIKSFDVKEISDYEQGSLSEALQSVSDSYGQQFDAVEDVDDFVQKIRHSV